MTFTDTINNFDQVRFDDLSSGGEEGIPINCFQENSDSEASVKTCVYFSDDNHFNNSNQDNVDVESDVGEESDVEVTGFPKGEDKDESKAWEDDMKSGYSNEYKGENGVEPKAHDDGDIRSGCSNGYEGECGVDPKAQDDDDIKSDCSEGYKSEEESEGGSEEEDGYDSETSEEGTEDESETSDEEGCQSAGFGYSEEEEIFNGDNEGEPAHDSGSDVTSEDEEERMSNEISSDDSLFGGISDESVDDFTSGSHGDSSSESSSSYFKSEFEEGECHSGWKDYLSEQVPNPYPPREVSDDEETLNEGSYGSDGGHSPFEYKFYGSEESGTFEGCSRDWEPMDWESVNLAEESVPSWEPMEEDQGDEEKDILSWEPMEVEGECFSRNGFYFSSSEELRFYAEFAMDTSEDDVIDEDVPVKTESCLKFYDNSHGYVEMETGENVFAWSYTESDQFYYDWIPMEN